MDYRTLIDAQSLEAMLAGASADGRCVVLDCRFNLMQPEAGLEQYQQGHIPTAVYAHLDHDLSSPIIPQSGRHPLPDPQRLAKRLGEWGIAADTQVVVYDDMAGAMAARAWWLLRWLGHERVALLDGGLSAWIAAAGAISSQSESPACCGEYPLKLHSDWLLNSAEVAANLAAEPPGFCLVDARNVERFVGEQEPIDPVAGHVPAALNRPLSDNLTPTNSFKSPDQLRGEWLALLGASAADDAVMMCGSGVTACHNLLAMEIAGLKGGRLYAGSWSEWIRDPQRPIATGA
ncbi:MAG: sulfurtransferase [Halopseudomonas sp.]